LAALCGSLVGDRAALGLPSDRQNRELRHIRRPPLPSPVFLDFSGTAARVPAKFRERFPMAKSTTIKVKLVSSADTGFYYVTKKNSRTMTDKLVQKKYDPVAKKHVEFREAKIK
jgi:large subunit ribosomal protein L33